MNLNIAAFNRFDKLRTESTRDEVDIDDIIEINVANTNQYIYIYNIFTYIYIYIYIYIECLFLN